MNYEETRPDPEELLASIRREEEKSRKGKLKIFFGMCAGVGKTYTMLQSARTDQQKGLDVIIGYAETHNRKETDDLLTGLPLISRKIYTYKGTTLEEPDIDAILERHPQIVLIDELAHTNAPGSRHVKRYQDVLEILDNGIHVYTTLNVQHLESRSDTVTQITGSMVRETLPDEIFEKADEVELVDITPDELLQRFSEGKVYTPERSVEAIRNFFRKGNITALREMSLRIVADRVDKQLRQYMHEKRIPGPWKSGLRMMAVIGPSPSSGKLLRWAKNLSYTMGASLFALHVQRPGKITAAQQEQLSKNINLARQLGAEIISTTGDDIVRSILSMARKENITHIIIGKPRHRTLLSLLRLGNLVNRLIRHSGNIDVYVLGSDMPSDKKSSRYVEIPPFSSGVIQYLISGIITIGTALAFFPLKEFLGYQVVAFALLFAISILSIFLGIGPILLSASLSAIIWDYFFIPPSFTLHVEKTEDIMMLVMYFIIALLNGILTSRLRKQEKMTREREERTNALYDLVRELSLATGTAAIVSAATANISKYFKFPLKIILQGGNDELVNETGADAEFRFTVPEWSIATWTYQHGRKAGQFTDTLPSTSYTFYPLNGNRLKIGVIAVRHNTPFSAQEELFWDTFKSQVSNALESEFLNELARKAQVLDESDRLYRTLFSSISHELRIPVATIMGASDALMSVTYDRESYTKLCAEILTASELLNQLIENLLNMSRLESGRITPRSDWHDVHDLVNKVTTTLKNELIHFDLDVVIAENTPLVKIDFGLTEQILHNLVLNATQYAPRHTTLRIKVYYDQPHLILQVMDRGPGFPKDALTKVFNKFYRVEGTIAGGTGLGLSIVKGFTEAQNGTVAIENRQNGGATVTVRIPAEVPEMEMFDNR